MCIHSPSPLTSGPVPPGSSFTYRFLATRYGTTLYHHISPFGARKAYFNGLFDHPRTYRRELGY